MGARRTGTSPDGARSRETLTRGGERYRVEALLGEGGMGAVFRARHLSLDRPPGSAPAGLG